MANSKEYIEKQQAKLKAYTAAMRAVNPKKIKKTTVGELAHTTMGTTGHVYKPSLSRYDGTFE